MLQAPKEHTTSPPTTIRVTPSAPAPRQLPQEDVGTRSEEAREDPLGLRPVEGHQRLETLPERGDQEIEGLSTTGNVTPSSSRARSVSP